MVRIFFILSGLLLLTGCGRKTTDNSTEHYLTASIQTRSEAISELVRRGDTLLPDLQSIEKKVQDLILMSKDIENLPASINLSDAYFARMARTWQLDSALFQKLNFNMQVDEITLVLRQNQLVLLEQMLLKRDTGEVPLFTAH